jgi:hypothetical protein
LPDSPGAAGPAAGKTVTEITVTGTDYSHLKALADLLAPKGTVLSEAGKITIAVKP